MAVPPGALYRTLSVSFLFLTFPHPPYHLFPPSCLSNYASIPPSAPCQRPVPAASPVVPVPPIRRLGVNPFTTRVVAYPLRLLQAATVTSLPSPDSLSRYLLTLHIPIPGGCPSDGRRRMTGWAIRVTQELRQRGLSRWTHRTDHGLRTAATEPHCGTFVN